MPAGETPRDLAIERAALGALMLEPLNLHDVRAAGLNSGAFFLPEHGLIYRAIEAVVDAGDPLDLISVRSRLQQSGHLESVGSTVDIARLIDEGVRAANIRFYAGELLKLARLRDLIGCARLAERHASHGHADRALDVMKRAIEAAPLAENDDALLEPIASVAASIAAEPPKWLAQDFLMRGNVSLFYGHERTFKSLVARELSAAVGLGRPAFHLSRLSIPEPGPVCYFTEEDAPGAILEHLDAFSNGAATRGALPLYLSACRGIALDDARTQGRILRELAIAQPVLVVLEPLRSLTSAVDQGPRELQPFTQFLRQIIRETNAAILLGHHAVKAVAGPDGRRGNQRVSGGGLLSICEFPVECARVDDHNVTLTPRGFKHTATPASLNVRLETQHGRVSALVATEYAPPESAENLADSEVLAVVRANPGLSGSAIAARAHCRKADVLRALPRLAAEGLLRSAESGRGATWHIA